MEFQDFPKMARWSREIVITEKLDGTNAQICIDEDGGFKAGSRTRWITPEDDNYGFATWAMQNKDELMKLGVGRHHGEWWGQGIQRGYAMTKKRFSLFNTFRWTTETLPGCCAVVPVIYQGIMVPGAMEKAIKQLAESGSIAAPGFMNPEGIVLFHVAGNVGFKKTIHKDEAPKSKQNNQPA